jgi:HlyD family secretion protein
MEKIYAWIVAIFAAIWPGSHTQADTVFFGYVEGEYVRVAPEASGILETLEVARGDTVAKGDLLFGLDQDKQKLALERARAELASARLTHENISTGQRPEEIAVIERQLGSAEADFKRAEAAYQRAKELARRQFVSDSELEQRQTARDVASAAVERQKALLDVARLPARRPELERAEKAVQEAQLTVDRASIDIEERTVNAPAQGYVDQTYYLPGEFVPAGTPVVSLLPPGEIKFRFFVPEPLIAKMQIGMELEIACDGCRQPVTARLSYLSSSVEFTPPVIYSLEERSKLVFAAEARPVAETTLLPGQPIEVRLAQ